MAFASAVIFLGVQIDLQPPAAQPRVLYERAAILIESQQTDAAASVLEELEQQHSTTHYAEIAVPHLAECYQQMGQPLRAVDLLDRWRDKLEHASAQATAISPDIFEKARALHTLAFRAAALEYEQEHDYSNALQLLGKALQSAGDSEGKLIEKEFIRTAVASCLWEVDRGGNPDALLTDVSQARQIPIRFALAEKLLAAREETAAEVQLKWLAKTAAATTAAKHSDDFPSAWETTVALRHCEVLVRQKRFTEAEEQLVRDLDRFSDWEQRFEFGFLLARCAIAQVKFELAITTLLAVGNDEMVPQPSRAKSFWMLGEIYFLKQDFLLALEAYQRAMKFDAPHWQSLALLQMAKCQELMGNRSAALTSYERLQSDFSLTSAAAEGATRAMQLSTTMNDLEEPHQAFKR